MYLKIILTFQSDEENEKNDEMKDESDDSENLISIHKNAQEFDVVIYYHLISSVNVIKSEKLKTLY